MIIHPPPHSLSRLSLSRSPVPHFGLPPLFIALAFFLVLRTFTDTHTQADRQWKHRLPSFLPPIQFLVTLPSPPPSFSVTDKQGCFHPSGDNLPLCLCFLCPTGEPAASSPYRVQPEGQEGPLEARKGEHHASAPGHCYCLTIKTQSHFVRLMTSEEQYCNTGTMINV